MFSSAENIDTLVFYIKSQEYEKAIKESLKKEDKLFQKYAEILFYNGEKDSLYFNKFEYRSKLNTPKKEIIYNLFKGSYEQIYKSDNLKAFKYYQNALELSKKNNFVELQKVSLLNILDIYRLEIFFGNLQYDYYLEKFSILKQDHFDEFYLAWYNIVFITKTIYNLNPKYFNYCKVFDSIYHKNKFNNHFKLIYYGEKGLQFKLQEQVDSAIYYNKLITNINLEVSLIKSSKYSAYLNLAELYLSKKDFNNSKKNFELSKKYFQKSKLKYDKFYYYRYVAKYFEQTKKFDSAYYALKKSLDIEYDLNYKANSLEISQLNELYQKEEKEKQLLLEKQKKKQNQNLFYGALAVLFFSGIIYFQNLKNSRKKRLLAQQGEELEKQKNLNLIKEQEIVTINAMVNGQEKERVRIAEDLHDNIGSVLATLKLHFENLKLNREKKHFNQDELYQKTEKLIDETYFKVRSLAHAKNAGVIANKGLLSAVKIMAEKISTANKITIEVLDYGLEKRLENKLELTIFRIIQELTTNIIKHAEATTATINLSLYDNNLNIIIEDNGKGFEKSKIELKNDGMGLSSIKTRVKHLEGTFEIDSTLEKGTTVLMNVPV